MERHVPGFSRGPPQQIAPREGPQGEKARNPPHAPKNPESPNQPRRWQARSQDIVIPIKGSIGYQRPVTLTHREYAPRWGM